MRYHNITYDDMLNGEGLRTVLWVSGCNHACPNCHNQITWDCNSGLIFDQEAEKELFTAIGKKYISGVTFSGGDPLFPANRDEILRLAKKIKEEFKGEKSIWLYTGYLWEQISNLEILEYVDIIVDGRFVEELKDNLLHWRGSSNQRIIDVQKTLKKGEVVLYNV